MFKKLNSLFFVLTVLVGCIGFCPVTGAAAVTQEPDRLSYALHITEKKDADKTVTRGDAAGIVLRLLGYEDSMLESEEIFDDVSGNDKNANAITTAYKLGIISGTAHSSFEPDKAVTYEQLLKMIVVGLGYEERAIILGGYPYGYGIVASELGIDKNVTIENYDELDVRTVSLIVENALEAVVYPEENIVSGKDNTLLYKKFKLKKYSGVVTAAYASSYTPNSYAREKDDVYINDTHYKIGDSNIGNILGYNVEFYIEDVDADIQTVIFAKKKNYLELELSPQDIEKVTVDRNGIYIEYYETDNSRRAVKEEFLFESTSLIYNGFYTDITKSEDDLFDFSDGTVKLIDNNKDGVWEYLVIDRLTTVVVKSYSESTQSLTFEYAVELGAVSTQKLDFTDYDTVVFDGDLTFAGLKVGDVLEIRMPKNDAFSKKTVRVAASSNIVRAELTAKESSNGRNYMIMGANTYELSDEYAAYAETAFDGFQIGVEYTMYLTSSGKVAYIVNHLEEERVYGYLTDMAIGMFDTVSMKVYMDDGKFHYLDFADKVRVYRDGTLVGTKTASEITQGLFVGGAFDKNQAQLIRFMPDRNSKVVVIEFAQNALGHEAAADGYLDGKFVKSRSKYTGTYFQYSQIVYDDAGPEFPFPASATCFTVPANIEDLDDERNFIVGGFSGSGRVSVTVDTYNDDAVGVPGIVVRYGGVNKYQEFPLNTAMTVVKKIVNCFSEEGESCEKLIDIFDNEYIAKKEDNVFVDKSTGEKLKCGDAIQIGTKKGGFVQFVEMIFFTDKNAPNGYGYTYSDPSAHIRNNSGKVIASGALDSDRITASGYISALTSDYIRIRNESGDEAIFKCSGDAHYLFTVYTQSGNMVEERINHANIGDFVAVRCTLSNLQEVVRYID